MILNWPRPASHTPLQIEDVGNIFLQLAEDGLNPNTKTMNAMLKVCARLSAHGGACILDGFEMFHLCLETGMVLKSPAIVASTSPSPAAKSRTESIKLIKPMSEGLGIDQDDFAGAALSSASSAKEPTKASVEAIEEALSLLDGRVRPDVITYNTLIEICAKSALHGGADLQDGFQVVGLMRSQVMFDLCRTPLHSKCILFPLEEQGSSPSLSLSLSHTHTRTHAHTRPLPLSLSLSHTHTRPLPLSLPL